MSDKRNNGVIGENESIQEGLENFLDKELSAYSRPGGEDYIDGVYGRQYDPDPEDSFEEPEDDLEEDDYYEETPSRPVRRQAPPKQPRQAHPVKRREPAKAAPAKKQARPKAASHPAPKKPVKKKASAPPKRSSAPVRKQSIKQEKEKKKTSGFVKFILLLALLLVILFVAMNLFVGSAYNKMTYEESGELAKEPMMEEGVVNLLLIGCDSRQNGEDGRSDAMILISMNPKKKKIFMTSILRDSYVSIPGHGQNRLNAAYAYGGGALLCQTINENFGIEVNRYAIVNFQAFAALVEAVGGVDIDVTSEEVEWINAYLNEYNMLEGRDITTDYLDTSLSGNVHLNGPQALAYCRNRYIGTDFGRTERQRKVLSAIMGKVPAAMATNPNGLIDGIFPYLTTNLTQGEVSKLTTKMGAAATYETVQLTVPADGTWSNSKIDGKAVLEVDFEANKALLQEEIYGEGGSTSEGDASEAGESSEGE
ncbi:MAG: LCP family protein [Lachnospiraceae bacterium]|nr:LCP family protein [Lachnospiraceae bacterium]